MFQDKVYQKFQTLCGIPEGSDEPLSIAEIRQILLFRSNVLCPAHLVVSEEDGSFLPRNAICQDETLKWVKRQSWIDFRDFEKFKNNAYKTESKFTESTSYKCVLTSSQRRYLQASVEQSRGDCKVFRWALVTSRNIRTAAIHFVRWDGTPRQSIAEIQKAICIYPTEPSEMAQFLKSFIRFAAALTIGIVVANKMVLPHIRQLLEQENGWPQATQEVAIRNVNRMTKPELLAHIKELCFNDEKDIIQFEEWEDMTVRDLRTIVRILDNGGVDFFSRHTNTLRPGREHQRSHCFLLDTVKQWLHARKEQSPYEAPKHPLTDKPLTRSQIETLWGTSIADLDL